MRKNKNTRLRIKKVRREKEMYININIELLKNRMPIVQLAKELELSRNTVAKKIKGEKDWKLSEMKKMAKIFNKSILYLSTEEDINGTA